MKLKQLSLLCALACAGFAGQAVAQVNSVPAALAIVNDANTNNRILFISGASAVQGGLGEIANSLFQAGTSYLFHHAAATGRTSADYRAYAGRLRSAAGGWAAGTNVIIVNRARGGSVWGVNPVARPVGVGTAIESMAVTAAACTAGAGTSGSPFLCNTLIDAIPDAGVSDVAPKLFDNLYNTEGEPAEPKLSTAELASLAAQPIYGLSFGIPVTDNLPLFYLNKALLASLMTGNISTWNQVNASLPADDVLI